MTRRKVTTVRLPPDTVWQIAELVEAGWANQTTVIIIAVERMWREMFGAQVKAVPTQPAEPGSGAEKTESEDT